MALAIEKDYAYLESSDRWRSLRAPWRKKALAAKTPAQLAAAFEGALSELHDDNVFLSGDGLPVARRVPSETDVWAAWSGERAMITAVRASSVADVAGLHPGQQVVSVQGVAVDRVVREKVAGRGGDGARDWALRHALAGPRAGSYVLGVRDEGGPLKVLEVTRAPESNNGAPILARKVGEGRDIAYLRLKNTLADEGLVMHFDAALAQMKDARAVILDLRSTEGGGSEDVVRSILGRFVAAESPWQVRESRGKRSEPDRVTPRGTPFTGPLVVLVDRWTAGEGEALAAGLDAVANATLIGTSMAGLRGRAREVMLPNSGWRLRFPAERVRHVNGTPRESLRPDIEVDLVHPSGGPGDPILYQALKLLEKK
ncbi:hypothetical protein DSM104443_00465 [Usitatibacter rugosus]|uniref:Tail specific protease domain-containing protein n=1 Tax=Usitatibacter rugosus TaxID=2732067 RepID=A0A6M4GQB3_9PROT|nr:S41 family peptidase [Usitatibacter rugosus]QJR09421.1 hypothetical protein DSM104443_00465 [Usitatibacter rugosus]